MLCSLSDSIAWLVTRERSRKAMILQGANSALLSKLAAGLRSSARVISRPAPRREEFKSLVGKSVKTGRYIPGESLQGLYFFGDPGDGFPGCCGKLASLAAKGPREPQKLWAGPGIFWESAKAAPDLSGVQGTLN
jgi:hypothetical protein